jgi:hypothetical protein
MARDMPVVGWAWFDAAEVGGRRVELRDAAATCLGTHAGKVLIDHLRRVFLDRRVPPAASDAELRHIEGQRSVVAHILTLAADDPADDRPSTFDGASHD